MTVQKLASLITIIITSTFLNKSIKKSTTTTSINIFIDVSIQDMSSSIIIYVVFFPIHRGIQNQNQSEKCNASYYDVQQAWVIWKICSRT